MYNKNIGALCGVVKEQIMKMELKGITAEELSFKINRVKILV